MATTMHKTSQGLKRFSIQEMHYDRLMGSRHVAVRPTQAVAPAALPALPTWKQRLRRLLDAFVNLISVTDEEEQRILLPAPAETPKAIEAPKAATPTHYRAFSLLQPRVLIEQDRGYSPAHPAIVTFRNRAKTIKEQSDPLTVAAALAVLNTFVSLVDAFIPLWEAAGGGTLPVAELGTGARAGLRTEMLETVDRLDDELERILTPGSVSRERFDTVQRYVEMRYGTSGDTYDLVPVD